MFWAGGSPVLAYNVVLWAGLALTGWTTSVVLHKWTGDWWAALFGGSLAAFNTETLTRMGHIQAMHVEFLPLALLALDDLLRSGHRRDAVRLGVTAALQMLCSGYLLVMTAMSLTVALLMRPREWIGTRWRTRAAPLLLALAVTTLICAPFLYQYYRVQHDQGLVRSYDEVRRYAGVWQNFVATGARLHLHTWAAPFYREANSATFPGVLPVLLAGVAVSTRLGWRDPRARMWLAIGVAGAAISFGPKLPGYWLLYDRLVLLQGIRAVARFGVLALLASAVLAAFGLMWIRGQLARRHRHRLALAAGVLALIVVNVENTRVPMAFVRFEGIPAIYGRLAQEADAVVVELPFPEPARVAANARAVHASTRYWKPLLNGYSGYMPASYVRHWEAFRAFPDPSAIAALRQAGVTHIVVHVAQAPDAVAALQQVRGVSLFAADHTRRIYRIVP